jgi:dTMP kinase
MGRNMLDKGGLFITFEGTDGSGKTTQIKMLTEYLEKAGYQVVNTIEPGGTGLGKKIRHMLLSRENTGMSPRAETLLFQASRAELVEKVISPGLESGKIVICDRFFDSTIVYQGMARGLGVEDILDMSLWASGGLEPDLTFLLSIDFEKGRKRLSGTSPDRIEMEKDSFQQEICRGYRRLAVRFGHRITEIDAGLPIQEVFAAIREKVDRELEKL